MNSALEIHVKGIVQGVGFRPFVYRLAKRYLITGWVLNASDGVHIHAEGDEKLLDEFVMELSENAPAAAQVTEIDLCEVPLGPYDAFEIRFSQDEAALERTLVSPDLATCADCQRELFDPEDRRFRYPFINCTNCGPRFTIIDDLPYDRASTSMRAFEMCETCAAEYADPADRRFHAQPDACFECGPHIYISDDGGKTMRWGNTRDESDAIFAEAVKLLLAGKILAVKGLGGFHLACNANDSQAIAELRKRKHRDDKAFAVMLPALEDVAQVCEVGVEEAALLEGSERPIVLLKKRLGVQFATGLADKLPELGVMLPYTPVQHILLHDFAEALCAKPAEECGHTGGSAKAQCPLPMLVMTSGNLHDEPIVTDDTVAFEKLGSVADAFLGNDREILSRFDDSVVRVISVGVAEDGAVDTEEKAIQFIRRARGYAPLPITVAAEDSGDGEAAENKESVQGGQEAQSVQGGQGRQAAQNEQGGQGAQSAQSSQNAQNSQRIQRTQNAPAAIFATGPEQKNTFTLLHNSKAFVSQHIGDMEDAETFDAWLAAKSRYEKLFDIKPTALACDLHPEYLTSKWAHEQAEVHQLPLTQVQHHHAHIASVIAEHHLKDAVCGIAFDGTGYGPDGAIWGGEVLLANASDYERFANFAYVPMPGGAACVKNPLRMAYGVLWEYELLDHPGAADALAALGEDQAKTCETMIEQGLNTPYTSSVGRLFDAASALLGVCVEPTYEGEPAILLEAAMGVRGENVGMFEGKCDSAPASTDSPTTPYTIEVIKNTAGPNSTAQDTSVLLLDAAPVFRALLDDKAAGVPVAKIARRFHDAFVVSIVQAAQLAEALYGITTVALSGGVFMNRYIIENALQALERAGFTVAINRELPPNDGCISFGQAVVAFSQNR